MRASNLGLLQSTSYPKIILHTLFQYLVLAMEYAKEVKLGSKTGHETDTTRAHTSPSFLKDGTCTPQKQWEVSRKFTDPRQTHGIPP